MKWSKNLLYPLVKHSATTVIVLWAFASTGQAQEVFSSPKNISNTAHAYPYEQIAIDSSGNINAIWIDSSAGNNALFFARSTDGGVIFSAALNVSNHPSGKVAGAPQIALDSSGNIELVWQDNSPGYSAVFFSHSTDGGINFSAPLMVSNASATGGAGQIAVDPAGNIDVGWQDNSPGYFAIFFRRSTDGGSTFSAPVNISNNPLGTNSGPSMRLDSAGDIYVVWVGSSTYTSGGSNFNTQDIDFTTSIDGGNSFVAPSVVSAGQPGIQRQSPQVAASSSGNINVAWGELNSFSEVWSMAFSHSSDGGAAFGSPYTASTCTYPPSPQLALDSAGGIDLLWQESCGNNSSNVEFGRSVNGGASFTVNTLASPTGYSPLPQMAIDSSNNVDVAFYGGGISGDTGIFFTQSTDGGNTFSTVQDVSNDGGTNPEIISGSNGQIRMVWSAGNDVFFSGTLALSSLGVNPETVTGGSSTTGTLTLSGPAPSGGAVISLSSSNPSVAMVPASANVSQGSSSATFTVSTSPVSATTSVTLSASYNGVTQTALLSVKSSTLASVAVSPSSVTGGSSATGTVTLCDPAPAGGAVVSLSSSSAGVAMVPASVTVAAGGTSATFTVATKSVSASTSVTISATYGGASQSALLTIMPPAVLLSSLTLSPSTVTGGGSSTGTVTLSASAPSGGAVVSLSSGNSGIARVITSVTVAGGATSATFAITTKPVSTSTSVTITASFGGATRSASLTVAPPTLVGLTVSPSSVIGGSTSTGRAMLNGPAPSGGEVITLASSNPGAAATPASVTVGAGSTIATFKVVTTPVSTSTSVSLSATLNGVTFTAVLTVVPPSLTSLSLNPSNVKAGGDSTCTVTLSGPVPSGGVVISLASSNSGAAEVPSTVTVPAGAVKATFEVESNLLVLSQTNVTISASHAGVTRTASLTVVPLPNSLLGGVGGVVGGLL
jgi:hypothetical protein